MIVEFNGGGTFGKLVASACAADHLLRQLTDTERAALPQPVQLAARQLRDGVAGLVDAGFITEDQIAACVTEIPDPGAVTS